MFVLSKDKPTRADYKKNVVVDYDFHNGEIEKYKNLSLELVEKINRLKKENYKDKNYISMLEAKLISLNKQLKQKYNVRIKTERYKEQEKKEKHKKRVKKYLKRKEYLLTRISNKKKSNSEEEIKLKKEYNELVKKCNDELLKNKDMDKLFNLLRFKITI